MLASNYNSALSLDAADGVLDGKFYGSQIGISAPIYRTGTYGSGLYGSRSYGGGVGLTGLGLTGATSALSLGSYPTYGATSLPSSTTYGATSLLGSSYPSSLSTSGYYGGRTFTSGAYTSGAYSYPAISGLTSSSYLSSAATPVTYSAATTRPLQYVAPAVETVSVAAAPVVIPQVEYVAPPVMQYVQAPPQIQYIQAPAPQVQYIQSPPEIRYIQSPPEIRYIEAPPQPAAIAPPSEDPMLRQRIHELEEEIMRLRTALSQKTEVRSQTSVHQTYKVKTFEIAAKLATMDGTDDGLYNGLPIEVEGEGLYRDLVAAGRKPRANVSLTGRPSSVTTTSETYKVQSFEMAEKLSKMDGRDDGKYNGLPIEVAGQGLYSDLKARRGKQW